MNIGDLFLALRGDGTMLQKDVTKAGQAAGKTFGSQMSAGLRSAAGAGIGLALGAAISGANELDVATRQLQADTGLAGEEAKQASAAIASLYRDNLQGFDQIGAAMSKVITDLGLTGDAARETTDDFLAFSTATGQDAADSVMAVDDILDAFNLTAEDSQGVLDVLVKSHQDYGGSIEENEAALAKMAPALEAANLGFEDGTGLLNLFAASGIDAAKAPAALTKALSKVESPEQLQQLIADITATKDPFERAQKAIDLFGAKAGPQLAAALANGNIEDFVVSMGEAEGATDAAAEAVESGWGARFTKLMHAAGGTLAEFGTKFGPLLIVAAQLGPSMTRAIGGALGSLAGLAGPAIVRAGKAIGVKLMVALGAEVLANRAIGAALDGLPLTAGPKATTAGTKLGGLLSKGMAIGLVLGIAALADIIEPELEKVGNKVGMSIWEGLLGPENVPDVRGWLASLPWPWGPKDVPDISFGPFEHILGGSSDPEWNAAGKSAGEAFTEGAEAGLTAEGFAARTQGVAEATSNMVGDVAGELGDGRIGDAADAAGDDIEDGIGEGARDAATDVKTAAGQVLSAILGLRGDVGGAASAAADAIYDPFIKKRELAETQKALREQHSIIMDKDSTKKQVREARVRTADLGKQLFVQLSDMTTYGTTAQRIAAINAALTTEAVADAYRDGTPEQRAAIDEWRRVLTAQLAELQGNAGTGGTKTGTAYAGGLSGTKGTITNAADTATKGVKGELTLASEARTWGQNTANAYAAGLISRINAVSDAAYKLAKAGKGPLAAFSPPGPESPLHEIDKWGANTIGAWVEGMLSQEDAAKQATQAVAGAAGAGLTMRPPGMNLPSPGGVTPMGVGALGQASVANNGDVYNIHVPIDGLIKAGNPLEVAGQLRRLADLGVLAPKKPVYR